MDRRLMYVSLLMPTHPLAWKGLEEEHKYCDMKTLRILLLTFVERLPSSAVFIDKIPAINNKILGSFEYRHMDADSSLKRYLGSVGINGLLLKYTDRDVTLNLLHSIAYSCQHGLEFLVRHC